jgi:hypothetical protein
VGVRRRERTPHTTAPRRRDRAARDTCDTATGWTNHVAGRTKHERVADRGLEAASRRRRDTGVAVPRVRSCAMSRSLLLHVGLLACGKDAAPPPPASIAATAAFVDVTVVPMDSERALPHQTVLVNGDTIVTSPFGPASGTYVVDDQGFPVTITLKTGFGEFVMTKE